MRFKNNAEWWFIAEREPSASRLQMRAQALSVVVGSRNSEFVGRKKRPHVKSEAIVNLTH